ncbi:MAG: hypothetical protein J6B92_05405 [Paraprevotella sp.]|nr:hypothetical protein [Paraprevotella sp.]
MKVRCEIFSECGPRWKNEDYIKVIDHLQTGRFMAVLCDGMGGHRNGDIASKLVAEHICTYWQYNQLQYAHCGDSRIYHIRQKEIIYRSADHIGITPEGWPIVKRAFYTGTDTYLPEIIEADLFPGDYIFICSDGVYGGRKEKELEEILCCDNCTADFIKNLASSPAHDSYSGILIEIK